MCKVRYHADSLALRKQLRRGAVVRDKTRPGPKETYKLNHNYEKLLPHVPGDWLGRTDEGGRGLKECLKGG